MSITVKRNFNLTKDFERKLKKAQTALERGLIELRTEISRRTRGGQTVDGGAMQPYSDPYRKFKVDRGRNATPDLTFTGSMLRGIQTTVQRTKFGLLGRMFFLASEAVKARVHHLGAPAKNIPARPFFALSKEQIRQLITKVKEALK